MAHKLQSKVAGRGGGGGGAGAGLRRLRGRDRLNSLKLIFLETHLIFGGSRISFKSSLNVDAGIPV